MHDPDRRAAAISRTYAPDVVFSDPEESLTGHGRPGAKVQVLLDLGHLSWALGPECGEPVVRGTDVALIRDGVIARLYTFLRQGTAVGPVR